jgi:hypothetical protein
MRVCEKNRRLTDKAERKKSKKLIRGGETQNRKRKEFFRIKWKRKPHEKKRSYKRLCPTPSSRRRENTILQHGGQRRRNEELFLGQVDE